MALLISTTVAANSQALSLNLKQLQQSRHGIDQARSFYQRVITVGTLRLWRKATTDCTLQRTRILLAKYDCTISISDAQCQINICGLLGQTLFGPQQAPSINSKILSQFPLVSDPKVSFYPRNGGSFNEEYDNNSATCKRTSSL